MRRWRRQAGLERASDAAADPVAANALRTAWLWLVRMEERRYARREQEARRTYNWPLLRAFGLHSYCSF